MPLVLSEFYRLFLHSGVGDGVFFLIIVKKLNEYLIKINKPVGKNGWLPTANLIFPPVQCPETPAEPLFRTNKCKSLYYFP